MILASELERLARSCSNVDYRGIMIAAAVALDRACATFAADHTRENLKVVNAAWANGERILKNMPPEAPLAPLAGSPEPARLAA